MHDQPAGASPRTELATPKSDKTTDRLQPHLAAHGSTVHSDPTSTWRCKTAEVRGQCACVPFQEDDLHTPPALCICKPMLLFRKSTSSFSQHPQRNKSAPSEITNDSPSTRVPVIRSLKLLLKRVSCMASPPFGRPAIPLALLPICHLKKHHNLLCEILASEILTRLLRSILTIDITCTSSWVVFQRLISITRTLRRQAWPKIFYPGSSQHSDDATRSHHAPSLVPVSLLLSPVHRTERSRILDRHLR